MLRRSGCSSTQPRCAGRGQRHCWHAGWARPPIACCRPGRLAGPVFMVRHLIQRGVGAQEAVAAITVSTTFQNPGADRIRLDRCAAARHPRKPKAFYNLPMPLLMGGGVLAFDGGAFLSAAEARSFRPTHATDCALIRTSRLVEPGQSRRGHRPGRAEHPCPQQPNRGHFPAESGRLAGRNGRGLLDARIPGTSGQLGRCACWSRVSGRRFAAPPLPFPAPLGVQEGGYLLLAPLAGLPPDVALALSLAKTCERESLGPAGSFLSALFRARLASPPGLCGVDRIGRELRARPSFWQRAADRVCSRRRVSNCPSVCCSLVA